MGLSGLLVEPLAWLQSWLWARRLRKAELPDDPIVVIGHWRSGTTYLHQLLACDPTLATARNSLTTAPQVALLLKPWIRWALQAWMTRKRPIDAVPWGPNDPQEDELGLARLSIDTNMAGMAFPLAYPWFFRRNVLGSSAAFERQWLHFTKLTWLHDGHGKAGLLIKNSAHSARVELVLRHFPRARCSCGVIGRIRSAAGSGEAAVGFTGGASAPARCRHPGGGNGGCPSPAA